MFDRYGAEAIVVADLWLGRRLRECDEPLALELAALALSAVSSLPVDRRDMVGAAVRLLEREAKFPGKWSVVVLPDHSERLQRRLSARMDGFAEAVVG